MYVRDRRRCPVRRVRYPALLEEAQNLPENAPLEPLEWVNGYVWLEQDENDPLPDWLTADAPKEAFIDHWRKRAGADGGERRG